MPFINGAPIDDTGKMLVTTTAPTAAWPFLGGFAYDPLTTALAVKDAVPAANDPWNNGIRTSHIGQMYVVSTLPSPLFYVHGLPISGDGRVFFSSGAPIGTAPGGWPVAGDGGIAGSGLGPTAMFFAPLMTTLVPTVAGNPAFTFTRASLAYVADQDNILRQAVIGEARFQGARRVRNLLSNSNDITTWTKNNCTIVFGASDPVGGTAGNTVTATGANAEFSITRAGYIGQVGVTSMWIRRRTGTGVVQFWNTAAQSPVDIGPLLTGAWQRFGVAPTTIVGSAYADVVIAVSGDAIDVYGPQIEVVTAQSNQAPSEYVSVGVLAAPYHGNGVDGVKYFATTNGNSVAANVVTEAPGTAIPLATTLGYVAEFQATNFCLASQVFGDALWTTKTGASIVDNSHVAPDGTTTADSYGAIASAQLAQQINIAITGYYTFSVYMKRLVGTGAINLTPDNASVATTNVAGQINSSTWTRVSVRGTLSAGNVFPSIFIPTVGDQIAIWGAQFENLDAASSYIPTTTVAATRVWDVLQYQCAGNLLGTVGSAFTEFTSYSTPQNTYGRLLIDSTNGNAEPLGVQPGSNKLYLYDGAYRLFDAITFPVVAPLKVASKWGAGASKGFIGGAASAAQGFDGDLNLSATFSVGNVSGGNGPIFGTVRNVNIFATALTDAELIALTTIPIPPPTFFAPLTSSLVPTTAGNPTPTFTRATTAYVSAVGPAGNAADGELLIAVAANEARFAGARRVSQGVWAETYADGSPIPAAKLLGYVAENAATNLCLQSQTFDNAAWTQDAATIAANSVVAPDGTLTADTFTDNATNTVHRIYQASITVTTVPFSFSLYLKAGTLTWAQIQIIPGTGVFANFNLATGAVGNKSAAVTSSIQALPNGWYRCILSTTIAAAGPAYAQISSMNADINSLITPYIGTGQTMFLWGAQVEQAAFATSYIPTAGVAVTRVADVLTYAITANLDLALGTSYTECYLLTAPANQTAIGFLSPAYSVQIYDSFSKLNLYSPAGIFPTVNSRVIGSNKGATAWSGATTSVALNGGAVATGPFTAWPNTGLFNTGVGAGPSAIQGSIRNVKFWNTRLIDEQLKVLTT